MADLVVIILSVCVCAYGIYTVRWMLRHDPREKH
jgi:hypothetical protein